MIQYCLSAFIRIVQHSVLAFVYAEPDLRMLLAFFNICRFPGELGAAFGLGR
jgi:hypothetical protein